MLHALTASPWNVDAFVVGNLWNRKWPAHLHDNSSPLINSSPNHPLSPFAPLQRPHCLFLSTPPWLVILSVDICLRQHRVLHRYRNRFLPQHSCFFNINLNERKKSLACLYFLLYQEQDMRRTLNISMNSLVPSEMEVILSLNIYILSFYNISGAVDTVVKTKCMTLTFFLQFQSGGRNTLQVLEVL